MDSLLTVKRSTHHYCQQCRWIAKPEKHQDNCKIKDNHDLNDVLVALQFARDMLECNDSLGDRTAKSIDAVLNKYPRLTDKIPVMLMDDCE